MSKMVIMRKLDNDGNPIMVNGQEVVRHFEARMADQILRVKGVKWEVVEDYRKEESKPRPARTEEKVEEKVEEPKAEETSGSEEPEAEAQDEPSEDAPAESKPKKRGRPKKSE